MGEANQITCPHCGQPYAVRPEQWAPYHGRTINCTKCGQPFVVTAPPQTGGPAPPPLAAAPSSPYAASAPYPQPPPGYAPQYPPPGYGYPPYPPPSAPTSGWALAALIFGILGFCLPILGSLLGIIFGIVGISKTRDNRAGGRGIAVAGLVLGIVTLLAAPVWIAILLPAVSRVREQNNRVKCAADMRMLAQAMLAYANANGDHYPDSLEGLLKTDPSLSPSVFVCPSSDKTPPDNSSPQKFASEIASGQHTSYIYLGKGLDVHAPADTVLIYEPLEDHAREGMNVLFGDGHVAFLDRYQSQIILDERAAGTLPVTYPARSKSGTTSSPSQDSSPDDEK
jgi:predicted Zn finger-like uncharacterized protein/prepilin-type processing-associated H-X9-DG protein